MTQHAAFEILAPREWSTPVIFNSPHSGTYMPLNFLQSSVLSQHDLRSSEDCYVDELFSGCIDLGMPLLRALYSRSYIDLNREPFEFDPKLFAEPLPGFMNTLSPRVASGLGTIPRLVGDNQQIYRTPLALSDAINRVENVYRPYHRALSGLVQEAQTATGFCLLIDCHSMPSSAVSAESGQVDIVIGDRFGAASAREYVELLEQALIEEGLSVRLNRPYAGGFITENHGEPRRNRHAIQIEINRNLYLHETRLEKTVNFAALQKALSRVTQRIADAVPTGQRLAAE